MLVSHRFLTRRPICRRGFRLAAGTCFAGLLALTPSQSGAQTFEWIRRFGTETDDQAHAIAVHSSGIYVTGRTFGELPGQTHTGNWDIGGATAGLRGA